MDKDEEILNQLNFRDCGDMIDYLCKSIVKDIEYSHKHNSRLNVIPKEDKLKVALIKSMQETYQGILSEDINTFYDQVVRYRL